MLSGCLDKDYSSLFSNWILNKLNTSSATSASTWSWNASTSVELKHFNSAAATDNKFNPEFVSLSNLFQQILCYDTSLSCVCLLRKREIIMQKLLVWKYHCSWFCPQDYLRALMQEVIIIIISIIIFVYFIFLWDLVFYSENHCSFKTQLLRTEIIKWFWYYGCRSKENQTIRTADC